MDAACLEDCFWAAMRRGAQRLWGTGSTRVLVVDGECMFPGGGPTFPAAPRVARRIVVFVLRLIEHFAWVIVAWVPLYRLARLGLLFWLAHPQFNGATFVYDGFVRPFLMVAADRASTVPALRPYVSGFLGESRQQV